MRVSLVKPSDRFGALVVLARSGHYSNAAQHEGILWRCRCDCGREVDVSTVRLVRDNKRYCVREYHPEEHGTMKRAGLIRSKKAVLGRPRTIAAPFRAGGLDDDFDDWEA